MKIAVISDTHNRLPAHILPLLGKADEIWHLGDVCDTSILMTLKSLELPTKIVRGNCDSNMTWPLTLDFKTEGFRIRLMHIPPKSVPENIDILLHGHTHIPRNERIGETRFYNPGTVGGLNKGAPYSFAWLTLEKGKAPGWELCFL